MESSRDLILEDRLPGDRTQEDTGGEAHCALYTKMVMLMMGRGAGQETRALRVSLLMETDLGMA